MPQVEQMGSAMGEQAAHLHGLLLGPCLTQALVSRQRRRCEHRCQPRYAMLIYWSYRRSGGDLSTASWSTCTVALHVQGFPTLIGTHMDDPTSQVDRLYDAPPSVLAAMRGGHTGMRGPPKPQPVDVFRDVQAETARAGGATPMFCSFVACDSVQ